MNKIYISYFYQIRNFNRSMIPISTAVWDPKWYHNFQSQSHLFKDKNGVYNGIRNPLLMPGKSCEGLCNGRCAIKHPESCEFIKAYREQLDEINFADFITDLEDLITQYKLAEPDIEDPIPVLIVHEAPDNPCSERVPLIEWLRSHHIECEEFQK